MNHLLDALLDGATLSWPEYTRHYGYFLSGIPNSRQIVVGNQYDENIGIYPLNSRGMEQALAFIEQEKIRLAQERG